MTSVFYLHNPPMPRPSPAATDYVFDAVLHYPNFLILQNIPLPRLE